MKGKMERQHLLRGGGQTTPVRQNSAQYQWRRLRGELSSFQKKKTADHTWRFFSGWGRRLKKDRRFRKRRFAAGHLGTRGNNAYRRFPAIKLQDLSWITCAESPFNFHSQQMQLNLRHTRIPESEPSITTAGAAEQKTPKGSQHVPGV